MIIRKAGIGDLDSIMEGARQFVGTLSGESSGLEFNDDGAIPFFTMMVQSPMFVVFVAEQDGIILGAIGASAMPWFCNKSQFTVEEMFWWVFPEYRGGTAGIRLHKRLEEYAKEMGATSLYMSCADSTDNPVRLGKYYERKGYTKATTIYVRRL